MAVLNGATSSGRQFYQGQPSGVPTVATPATLPTLSAGGTGGTLPTATYYAKYTWVTAVGETAPSGESTGVSVTLGQTLTVTIPTLPSGAVKANIYISSATGTETLQGSTTSTTFAQSLPLVTGNALPVVNTTGATTLYTSPNFSTNVTATTAGTSGSAGTTTSTISTGSAGSATAYMKEYNVVNTSGASANYSLFIVPNGGIAIQGTAYDYNSSLSAGNKIDFSGVNAMMPAGSSLMAVSSVPGAITMTISGVEVQ